MEKELHKRELLGRLVSDRLTPRQFEIMSGFQSASHGDNLDWVKDVDHQLFLDRREDVRLAQEFAESTRRRKVIAGEWTEAESHERLQAWVQAKVDQQMTPSQLKYRFKDIREILTLMKIMDSPERLLEKEYHFDEGLGQSLNEHVAEVKDKFPDMKVETRRDRDGFAIVKTSFKRELKYKLDEIINFDPEKEE